MFSQFSRGILYQLQSRMGQLLPAIVAAWSRGSPLQRSGGPTKTLVPSPQHWLKGNICRNEGPFGNFHQFWGFTEWGSRWWRVSNVNMFQGILKKKTCKNGKDMRYVISQPLDYQIFQTPNTQSRFHQPIVSWNCCTLTPMSMWKTMENPPKVRKKTNYGDGSLPPISYIHLWFDTVYYF